MKIHPKFKEGESMILFLYQKPVFGDRPSGNDYAIVNSLQGQYGVDNNGLTGGLVSGNDVFVKNITIADFEKKITEALSNPRTNNTHISNDTDNYRNDTDMIYSNDFTAEMLDQK